MNDDTKKLSNPKDHLGDLKPGISNIPMPVLFLLGAAFTEGTKYGAHNYRDCGVRASVYFNAAFRHMADYWEGEDIDPDSGLPHLAKAMACFTIILDADMNDMLTDDRPIRAAKGWMKKMQRYFDRVLENVKGKVLPPFTQKRRDLEDDEL